MKVFLLVTVSLLVLSAFTVYGIFFKKTKDSNDGIPPDDRYPLW